MKIPKITKPKLKKSEGASSGMKPPKAVADLYADLHDRRLLPLVALLVVAIAAAPFVLADKSTPAPVAVSAPAPAKQTAATFSVVPAKPELREYRKRLQHRKRVSPFSTYAALRLKNETRETVEGIVHGEAPAVEVPVETEVPPTTTEPPTTQPTQPPPVHATIKANVGVAAMVKAGFSDTEGSKKTIESQTRLPKPENTVVIYTGPSKDGKGALFLMSNSVSAYYGSGECVVGGEVCQVLELHQGKSATFAVGYGETRYKVTFLGFEPIVREATIEPRRK